MICWDYGKKHSYKFVDLFVHGLSVVDAQGFIKGGRKRKGDRSTPSSLAVIDAGVFSYTRLETVLIPKSVKLIGDETFFYCSRLKRVEFASFNAPEKFGKSACH